MWSPAGRLATPVWRLIQGDALDYSTLQQPLADAALHDVGEKAAAQYPGYQDMGLQPAGKVRLRCRGFAKASLDKHLPTLPTHGSMRGFTVVRSEKSSRRRCAAIGHQSACYGD